MSGIKKLVLPAIGGMVGYSIGGPPGAMIGASLGGAGNSIVFPGGGGGSLPTLPTLPPPPTMMAPMHMPMMGFGGGFDFQLPAFPEIPEPEEVPVMPMPDDQAIRAAKRREMAGRGGGRLSTLLSTDPNSKLV